MWPFKRKQPVIEFKPEPVVLTKARVFYYTDVHGVADHLLAHAGLLITTDFSKLTARVTARLMIDSFSGCLPQLIELFEKQNSLIETNKHAALTALSNHYQTTTTETNLEFYLADEDALPIDVPTQCAALMDVLLKHTRLVAKSVHGNFYYQRLSMPLYKELYSFLHILDNLEDITMD